MLKFYDLQSINLLIKTLSLYLAINLTFNLEIKTCDWVDDLLIRSISLMTCVSVDDSVSLMTWVWLLMINEIKRLDLVLITFELNCLTVNKFNDLK